MMDIGPRLLTDPTHPASAFAPNDRTHLPGGGWLYLLAAPILAALVNAAARTWVLANSVTRLRRGDKDGRWARSAFLPPILVKRAADGRLVLGHHNHQLIGTENHHSVIVFAPRGSGKTTALVIPALLEHQGPAVTLSAKTNLLCDTLANRTDHGPVYIHDPLGITGQPCTWWTPLRSCRDWAEAQRMAETLTSAVGETGVHESYFWDTLACKLLEPLLHAAALDDRTMRDVVRWVDTREQVEVATILNHHNAQAAMQSWTSSLTRDHRTLSGVYASTEVLLRAYSIPGMSDSPITGSFNPNDLLKNNGTLYVCAPTEDQARLRPIFAALVKDIYHAAVLRAQRQGILDPSLLLVLDEAANIAPVNDLAQIASTCRDYGIQLITVFHDLAQVQARYGTKARTIVNNHTAKLLLPGTYDPELLELLTNLLGDERVEEITHSRNSRASSRSHSTRYRPLAAMQQLRQLPLGSALLLYGNLPPVKIMLRPWYADSRLRRLARKNAA